MFSRWLTWHTLWGYGRYHAQCDVPEMNRPLLLRTTTPWWLL